MSEDPIVFEDDIKVNVDETDFVDHENSAMHIIAQRSARRTGWLGRLFIGAIGALLALIISISFWDFATGLLAKNQFLGQLAIGLFAIIILGVFLYILREIWALFRLRRTENLRKNTHDAYENNDLARAKQTALSVAGIYRERRTLDINRFETEHSELLDAHAILEHCERKILKDRDAEAILEIQSRARRVAVITAFVPIALADLITVLATNIGMIRAIAEIYGGRPGLIGGWRLFGRIAQHLVATGALAVGDDVIGSVMGGGLLTKLSRRFGEGVINGALTARVGIAAMNVCRPMDFHALDRPSTSKLISTALAGFVTSSKKES